MEYGLGRLASLDPRDNNFLMRGVLGGTHVVGTKFWQPGPVLHQGRTNSCVGHSCRAFLDAAPKMTKGGPNPFMIYEYAKRHDVWPWNDNVDQGTSVRAGVQALQDYGHLDGSYLWAYNVDDMRDWVLTRGPMIVGFNFYAGMEFLTPQNYMTVAGPLLGGHAMLIYGWSQHRRAFRGQNSWGTGWGEKGRFWIHEHDVSRLLYEGGEAVSVVEVKVQPRPKLIGINTALEPVIERKGLWGWIKNLVKSSKPQPLHN